MSTKEIAADNRFTGTAAVVVAGLLTTMRVTKKKLCEQRILFFGAGGVSQRHTMPNSSHMKKTKRCSGGVTRNRYFQANTGVAEMCVRQMVEEGVSEAEACENIFMFDIDGLITKSRMASLLPRHKRFAKVSRIISCCMKPRQGFTILGTPRYEGSVRGGENSTAARSYRYVAALVVSSKICIVTEFLHEKCETFVHHSWNLNNSF